MNPFTKPSISDDVYVAEKSDGGGIKTERPVCKLARLTAWAAPQT